jgi:hypothetical protein
MIPRTCLRKAAQVAALRLDGAAFGAEIGEIGREDGGGDLDLAVEGLHGGCLIRKKLRSRREPDCGEELRRGATQRRMV